MTTHTRTHTTRSHECEAYLEALRDIPATVLSACDGWTVHEVTAHMAGTAAEVSAHLDPYLQGDEVPATRGFEEREAPYRALGHEQLCRRLEDEEQRMRRLVDQVLQREPDAVIPWTGRRMAVAKFVPHLRNEFALHRWDFAGDCGPGRDLLAQPELTGHAVEVLGEILLRRGREHDPAPDEDLRVRLRADGQRDLLLVVGGGVAGLEWAGEDGGGDVARPREPYLEMDAAARTLVIWGRRPDQRGRVSSHMPAETLARTQALLAGY